jgi:hypothetical protein
VAENPEGRKQAQQDSIPVAEFAKELPLSVSYTHKQETNNFAIPQLVMSSPCPVPDVSPENTVYFVERSLSAGMFMIVCPTGDNRVKVAYKYRCL